MNVLIFGASGMVGQGVLRECLLAPGVDQVTAIVRTPIATPAVPVQHPKLRQLVHPDLFHYESIEHELAGFDACFFCLGVSSAGMSQPDYERITYDITLAAAETLARLNPKMTFVYVSGAGTDSTEKGRAMWARVKGRTENALLHLPFTAYMFRPGAIIPLHGIESRTALYRIPYKIFGWLLPILRSAFPNHVLTTEQIGDAMLSVAAKGYRSHILETTDIRTAADAYPKAN